nr:histidine-containing phosphotransfer protein 1 [Quercus suber]
MVGTDLRQQLNNYIQSMCDQGILDNQFQSVQALKTEENPHFVLETVTGFCNDADNGIAQMTRYLCIEGMARLKHEYNSLKEGLNNISQVMVTLNFDLLDREANYCQCSKGTPVESWPVFAPSGASIEDQREGASTEDQSLRFYMLSFNSINWLTITKKNTITHKHLKPYPTTDKNL